MKNMGLCRMLFKVFPITEWLPKYDIETAIADLIAGITVGLTLIPQAIAYANLAGLSPQYGLYSSLAGGLIYMLFGTTPEISIGPTSLLSLLTYTYTHNTHPDFAVLLCFLSGCIELLCGILHLGFLVDFVSYAVVSAFTTAAAIIIASSQIKNLMGITLNAEGFLDVWIKIINNVYDTHQWDVILSISCCSFLLILKKIGNNGVAISKKDNEENHSIKKIMWFISVSRNAIIVVLCATITFVLESKDMSPFSLTGKVTAGLPVLSPPSFEISYNNHTANFMEITTILGSGIIVVPLVAIIGNVAISKAFAHGKIVDASQEMLALGMCNLAASFFKSMPINGAFSRSAVYNASGVRTPLGGLYTGTLVILALCYLTPYFSYIPKATLSSVLICAVVSMIDFSIISRIWNTNRKDLVAYVFTITACLLLGVEVGILFGMIIDIIILLYYNARPHIQIDIYEEANCSFLKPKGNILYPAVEHMRRAISNTSKKSRIIAIDCEYLTMVDFSAAQGIGDIISDLYNDKKTVLIIHITPSVAKILTAFCPGKYVIIDSNENIHNIIRDYTTSVMETDNSDIDITQQQRNVLDQERNNESSGTVYAGNNCIENQLTNLETVSRYIVSNDITTRL